MKTTVHIPDALFEQTQRLAAKEGTTFKDLVAEGLRKVHAERKSKGGYVLPDRSVGGEGLHPDALQGGWEHIRDEIYRGRGT